MVGQDAVELLGHRAVEGAHPGLDVRDRDARLGAGQRAGERRVRVAVDEHERPAARARAAARARRASARSAPCCVPPPRSSRCSGRGSPSSSKKTCESCVVVVLARVDEHLRRAARAGGAETAAALMNCGRFPMTVRTRIESRCIGVGRMLELLSAASGRRATCSGTSPGSRRRQRARGAQAGAPQLPLDAPRERSRAAA